MKIEEFFPVRRFSTRVHPSDTPNTLIRLTTSKSRSLPKPEAGRLEIRDIGLPGFVLRISATDARSYCVRYRLNGKRCVKKIGDARIITADSARKIARDLLTGVAAGLDPQGSKKALSLGQAFDRYQELYIRRNELRGGDELRKNITSNVIPVYGNQPLASLSRSNIIELLDDIIARGAPSTANHVFVDLRRFLNWCVSREYIDRNPCDKLKKPVKSKARERVLSISELETIWENTGAPTNFNTIIRTLLLTAARKSEVSKAKWEEFNFDEGLWIIPRDRVKNGREHVLPISSSLNSLLTSWKQLSGENRSEYVFPSLSEINPTFTQFSKGKRNLDVSIQFSNWVIHDLRRSVATHLEMGGASPRVIQKILNHVSQGPVSGVSAIYMRGDHFIAMREAMEVWGATFKHLKVYSGALNDE